MNFFRSLFSQDSINEAERQGQIASVLYGKDKQLTQYFAAASEYDHHFLEQVKVSPDILERSFFAPDTFADALCALSIMLEATFNDEPLPYLYPPHPQLREVLKIILKDRMELDETGLNHKLYRLRRYLYSIAPELGESEDEVELIEKLTSLFQNDALNWKHLLR